MMSISSIRYCLVAMVALSVSGCYSGGRWTMPDLAFWKTNPFSSSGKSAPTEPIPRPSQLASQPSPAPGAGYAPTSGSTAETLAPPYTVSPSATASQQPYVSAQTPSATSASPYMAPQQGHYDANAVAAATNPYPVTNPYTGTSAPQANPVAAQNYGSNPYGVPGAYESATPFGANQAAAAPQNYGVPAGVNSGYVAANPSGRYANPVREDGYYDQRLADYRSSAGPNGSAIPDYRTNQDFSNQAADNFRNQPAADYRSQPVADYRSQAVGDYRSQPVSDYRNQGANDYRGTSAGYQAQNQAAPTQQASSASQVPAAYNGNPDYQAAGSYGQSSGSYSPGDTGYAPPGVAPYQSPVGVDTSTSAAATSDPGYSPGSVGRYDSY